MKKIRVAIVEDDLDWLKARVNHCSWYGKFKAYGFRTCKIGGN